MPSSRNDELDTVRVKLALAGTVADPLQGTVTVLGPISLIAWLQLHVSVVCSLKGPRLTSTGRLQPVTVRVAAAVAGVRPSASLLPAPVITVSVVGICTCVGAWAGHGLQRKANMDVKRQSIAALMDHTAPDGTSHACVHTVGLPGQGRAHRICRLQLAAHHRTCCAV